MKKEIGYDVEVSEDGKNWKSVGGTTMSDVKEYRALLEKIHGRKLTEKASNKELEQDQLKNFDINSQTGGYYRRKSSPRHLIRLVKVQRITRRRIIKTLSPENA